MERLILIGCLLSFSSAFAAKQGPAIAVTEFQQEVDHYYDGCKGYHWHSMTQLKTMLEKELSQQGFRVVERQHIRKMYNDEFQMENLNSKTKAKAKRFTAAKFAVTGAVTELGICEEQQDSGVDLGGVVSLLGGPSTSLSVDAGGAVSKVKLAAKLINVETGEVVKAFEAETESKDKSLGLSGNVAGIGGRHRKASVPPIERAANEALKKIAAEIAEYINEK